MSKVIVVANLKGGTGKTMCSVQLAGVLAECKPTLLVDADPQGSALKWAELVDLPFPVAGLPSRTIHRQLASLATGRDRVVIDTPPGQIAIVASALQVADLVLVPVQPATGDLAQLAETAQLVDDAQASRATTFAVRWVLTRALARTRARRDSREVFEADGLPLLQTEIPQAQALALAFGQPLDPHPSYRQLAAELAEQGLLR